MQQGYSQHDNSFRGMGLSPSNATRLNI